MSGLSYIICTVVSVFMLTLHSNVHAQTWSKVSTKEKTRTLNYVGGKLLLGGRSIFHNGCGGNHMSGDGGKTWSSVGGGWSTVKDCCGGNFPLCIAEFKSVDGGFLAASLGDGVYRTGSLGSTWSPSNTGLPVKDVFSLAVKGNKVAAGTEGGVYVSENSGQQWKAATKMVGSNITYGVAYDGNRLLAGVIRGQGSYSDDDGVSWKPMVGIQSVGVYGFLVLADRILAGTQGNGVVASTDHGATFQASNAGMDSAYVSHFAQIGNSIFATSGPDGVYRSDDMGKTWKPFKTGLTNPYVWNLATDGSVLYGAAEDGSVWMVKP